jgi:hypothetical protein
LSRQLSLLKLMTSAWWTSRERVGPLPGAAGKKPRKSAGYFVLVTGS